MTNINDIAKRSGYSVATVSRFINNNGYVSTQAKEAIQQVIDEFDYVPNAIARDLSRGKTFTIGVVVPQTLHPFFTQLLYGIMDSAFAEEYNVLVLQSHYDKKLELQYLENLHRKAYDALIFISHAVSLKTLIKYQQYGPVVCCENPGENKIAAAFVLRGAAYVEAFERIKSQGFNKIDILLSRSPKISATSKSIVQAYQQVFNHYPPAEQIYTNLFNYADGCRVAQEIIRDTPDFIFGNSDDITAGVRQYYLDEHVELPALMGQENQISGKLLNLTTIDHHLKQIGKQACLLAISGEIKKIEIKSNLKIRK